MKRWSRCRASGRSARLRNRLAIVSCEGVAKLMVRQMSTRVYKLSTLGLLDCIHVSTVGVPFVHAASGTCSAKNSLPKAASGRFTPSAVRRSEGLGAALPAKHPT